MAYIDQSYFAAYSTLSIPAEFALLAERASDVIDIMTMYKAAAFDDLSLYIQGQIKKATAAEVEMLLMNGGIDALMGNNANSFSIGKFSMNQNSEFQTINGLPISPMIEGYLLLTGLLYKGLGDTYALYT